MKNGGVGRKRHSSWSSTKSSISDDVEFLSECYLRIVFALNIAPDDKVLCGTILRDSPHNVQLLVVKSSVTTKQCPKHCVLLCIAYNRYSNFHQLPRHALRKRGLQQKSFFSYFANSELISVMSYTFKIRITWNKIMNM